MPQVILISGKQGAGKTTLANHLLTLFPKSTRLSFADPMRSLVRGMLKAADEIGLDLPQNPETRSLMQFLGTEWGREMNPLLWVNYARKQTEDPSYDLFIFDDCRFRNEFNAFPDAIRIRLCCPEQIRKPRAKYWGNPDHLSETDLDGYLDRFDMRFDTSGLKEKMLIDIMTWLEDTHPEVKNS